MDLHTADDLASFRALGDDEKLRILLKGLETRLRNPVNDPLAKFAKEDAARAPTEKSMEEDRIFELLDSDEPPHDEISDDDVLKIIHMTEEIGKIDKTKARAPLWATLRLREMRYPKKGGRHTNPKVKRRDRIKELLGAAAFKLAMLEGRKGRAISNQAEKWLKQIGYTRLSEGTLRRVRQNATKLDAHVLGWYVLVLKRMLLFGSCAIGDSHL